jgi:hypothetical protein
MAFVVSGVKFALLFQRRNILSILLIVLFLEAFNFLLLISNDLKTKKINK